MSEVSGKRKRGRKKLTDDTRWSDREMLDFAGALQRYGSGDTKNIALAVKTKSESAVKSLIEREVVKARGLLYRGTGERRSDVRAVRAERGCAEGWPDARKWQRIAQNQMMLCLRRSEYSALLIPQIWARFVSEQPPPPLPEVIDVSAVYAFVGACVRGERAPPELPPKEAAVLLMIIRLLKELVYEMDISEEEEFVRNFRKATKFVPFKVKDEFKKKGNKAPLKEEPGCLPMPEDMFSGLSRHRKLVQSLNPLSVPVWLIEKEQQFLSKLFNDQ